MYEKCILTLKPRYGLIWTEILMRPIKIKVIPILYQLLCIFFNDEILTTVFT